MKTLWGSCNIEAKRIWLNLELAKKPKSCLVYVFVHEMTHLLERHHNDRFRELMDQVSYHNGEHIEIHSTVPPWHMKIGDIDLKILDTV